MELTQSANGDLSTDVEELADETSKSPVLLPERLEGRGVVFVGGGKSLRLVFKCLLRDLGKLGEEEGSSDRHSQTSDSEVDPLDVGEVVLVLAREEVLGSDQGAGERCDTVERLRELKTEVGDIVRGHDRDVRVRRHFKSGETTSDDGSADYKAGKDALRIGGADGELGDRPEENSAERVKAETHDDGEFVTATLENLTGDGGKGKVTDTEIGDLD